MADPIHISAARNLLGVIRAETDSIGVAVSFGKDSLATLDLCAQLFNRVEGYYLFRVAGLGIVEEWREQVRRRWGVNVRPYPHFDLCRCYRYAVLAPHWQGHEKTPRIGMADIENKFRKDADVKWIAYGWRRNDSFSRALIMKKCAGLDPDAGRVFPLRAFSRTHVLNYLKSRRIPRPAGLGREEQGGLDFHPEALAHLKEHYPADWAKWQRDFPFSQMQLARRTAKEEKKS